MLFGHLHPRFASPTQGWFIDAGKGVEISQVQVVEISKYRRTWIIRSAQIYRRSWTDVQTDENFQYV